MSAKYRRSWISLIFFLVYMMTATLAFSSTPELNGTVSQLDVSGRNMEVWSWTAETESSGVILFSHGALSAPWKYENLIKQWVAAGYDVHAPLHVDSTDHPQKEQYAGRLSWKARLEDIARLADEYGGDGYIMAGHSYGGLLALSKGGAKAEIPEGLGDSLSDERVRVVLALSPPAAIPGFIEKEAYGGISVPALIQTGTQDIFPGSTDGWQPHLDAYEMAKPGGHRYALVLEGVDHYFGGAICRPELPGPKQQAELATTAEISVLMIKAFYEHDQDSLSQLNSRLAANGPVVLKTK